MSYGEIFVIATGLLNIAWMMKVMRDISRSDAMNTKYFIDLSKNLVSYHAETQFNINECFRNVKIDILALQADLLRNTKADSTGAANRRPRTQEQRRISSERKKAWWANKRREESAAASPRNNSVKQPSQQEGAGRAPSRKTS